MNHHLRILQERIQAVSVGPREVAQNSVRSRHGESFEWALQTIVQRQEADLHAGHHYADVRHQLAIFVAVSDQNGQHIDGQQEAPKEQRAFHARPQRRNFIKRGKVPVAVRNHIRDGVIVGEKQIYQAEGSEKNQTARGHARLARAFDQQWVTRDDCRNASDKGIHGTRQG